MEFYNSETNKAWTTEELFAIILEIIDDGCVVDAINIPTDVDELTNNENIDEDIIGERVDERKIDVAGTIFWRIFTTKNSLLIFTFYLTHATRCWSKVPVNNTMI